MAATSIASYSGESGTFRSDNNRLTVPYKVFGASSRTEAVLSVWTAAPATVTDDQGQTLKKNALDFDFLAESRSGTNTTEVYDAGVVYVSSSLAQSEAGEVRITIDTSGGTQHITQSLSTVASYPTNAASFSGAIGVNSDGEVAGTDIGSRVFEFTVNKTFASGNFPDLGNIVMGTWHTNSSSHTFTDSVTGLSFTLLEGECLFKGARIGSSRPDGALEVNYSMAGSPNLTNQTVGSITGIAKGGFEHMWVRYAPGTNGTGANKLMVQRPVAAYVEQVYNATNFAGLGL